VNFVGIDLAWATRGNTGLCHLHDGKVIKSALVKTDDEIFAWVSPLTVGDCLVAIDAPIVVPNQTGRRWCETVVSTCFSRMEAGAHSSNRSMPAFKEGVRAERLAVRLGLNYDPILDPVVPTRRAIEVYPHPALVELFGLRTSLKYKAKSGRSIETRRVAFGRLANYLESLVSEKPAMDVTSAPRWELLRERATTSSSPAEMDRCEDEIDAFICAYIGFYYWTHGTSRCRIVGDLARGYIVTPAAPDQAKCLDNLGDTKT
jgi:predicted RNase H-like nuclease